MFAIKLFLKSLLIISLLFDIKIYHQLFFLMLTCDHKCKIFFCRKKYAENIDNRTLLELRILFEMLR